MVDLATSDVLATSRTIDDTWLLPRDSVDVVQTEDFVAYCRPPHQTSATYGRVQVWIRSARPLEQLAPEIDNIVQQWDANAAQWRFAQQVDSDNEAWLQSVGATLVLTEAVMARSLEGSEAQAWLLRSHPSTVSTTLVTDRTTFDLLVRIETSGWGSSSRSPALVAQAWADLQSGLASATEWAMVGSVDGVPASVARCVLLQPVVRLFGSVTLPDYRQRGLYSALLVDRCRVGREHGATMALTKARIDTSAPVLEHFGFRRYGLEHCWLVPCR